MTQPPNLTIRVPASTSNLGPGFDCLGLALGLYNDFSVHVRTEGPNRLTGRGALEGRISAHDNPFLTAYARIGKLAGAQPPPVDVICEGAVPVGVGLGSSAAAAVAGALAANRLLGSPFATESLLEPLIEIEGHPDNVAPALLGGLALTAMTAQGPLVHIYRTAPSWRLALLAPDYDMPTEKARALLPDEVKRADAVFNLARLPLLLDALIEGDAPTLGLVLEDRLHERWRAKKIKRHDRIRRAALEAGAAAAFISGSGPALAAFCPGEAVAKAVLRAMKAECEDAKFAVGGMILRAESEGARVTEIAANADPE
jgi:homoserine kinase